MLRYILILFLTVSTLALWTSEASSESIEETVPKTIYMPAALFPKQQAVLSAEVSAKVKKIHLEMGESFLKDEVLISLDEKLFAVRKASAKADMKAAVAELEVAERLHKDRSTSLAKLLSARREAARATANLKLVDHALKSCRIRAPFAGKIEKIKVNAHELVKEGQLLARIVNDNILRVRFLAPASLGSEFKKKTVVIFKGKEKSKYVEASITHISPTIDSASNTVEVFAEFDNSKSIFRSGMVGKVEYVAHREPKL